MKREIIITSDGSSTIHLPDWNEQYHSKHGAIQEAYHVFIKHGFHYYKQPQLIGHKNDQTVAILEIGFGTGLNALITFLESHKHQVYIDYTGVEAFPVSIDEVSLLNYSNHLSSELEVSNVFKEIHEIPWEHHHQMSPYFTLKKEKKFFKEIQNKSAFNLIYFDAFGARVQPELWTESMFKIMYEALKPGGVLVTYSAKGSVRRAMINVGFAVEKLPGPPGKREMLRAKK
ncbi:tRNA (5-methylaminomethyl-2-thiouridine)(34)-methyltransferase MnmD [Tamlana fucoidanivorans]|uniref:tRNA (5-methylaminomethyl-2-thiouridine)(34)-methyltransferase MnmD n=1 Tax=Allotamlana fucoidanivorans TaxID=2583814 RepID=A0A5C4SGP7_9FLAO|nr:tRNA (5-methylaminomethyl-2-thiouridine)(34)-methyltransferase MnmD [Tamlana fucoidanivorans]TNJ42868.1 tRNA (5-methylaminomethyl-2-thiouridine)(34)-methyltransferase MnmD [Tamlana fucoidanivorans]